ncbi:MAG: hypothetical protein ACYDB2_01095 [Acidimicrobiales bacterium]
MKRADGSRDVGTAPKELAEAASRRDFALDVDVDDAKGDALFCWAQC